MSRIVNIDHAALIGTIARTVAVGAWRSTADDEGLRAALDACLTVINGAAVLASFHLEGTVLTHTIPRMPHTESRLREIAEKLLANGDPFIRSHQVEGLHVVTIPMYESRDHYNRCLMGYVALYFTSDPAIDTDVKIIAAIQSIAALLFQALHVRVRLFLPFAPRVAERYWTDSALSQPERLAPPFGCERETVTLVFDVRKSTFLMSQSPLADFAKWLDRLVSALKSISHFYGGVFDKFTGDGVMVHFLADASRVVDNRNPVVAALLCAIAMQRAATQHIEHLTFVRYKSSVIGGAIGIDSAPARWSLDYRDNPITIGPGVVNACRVSDKANAGRIHLTHAARQQLDNRLINFFTDVPFESKDLGKTMKLTVCQLQQDQFPFDDSQAIDQICEASWGAW